MTIPLPSTESTALITGASAGIGAELARELARRGYGLTITARRADRLDQLAAELRDTYGSDVTVLPCDLGDDAERERLIGEVAAHGKRVDLLINNAGVGGAGRLQRLPKERVMEMVDTNIRALVALTREYVEPMVERGSGAIMNVASTAGFQPIPTESVYSASKAFVLHFGEALDVELSGTGVHCTTLCPGPTRTEFAAVAGSQALLDQAPDFVVADARDVAIAGVDALVRGKRRCIPGKLNKVGAVAGSKAPRPVVLKTLQTFWPSSAAHR